MRLARVEARVADPSLLSSTALDQMTNAAARRLQRAFRGALAKRADRRRQEVQWRRVCSVRAQAEELARAFESQLGSANLSELYRQSEAAAAAETAARQPRRAPFARRLVAAPPVQEVMARLRRVGSTGGSTDRIDGGSAAAAEGSASGSGRASPALEEPSAAVVGAARAERLRRRDELFTAACAHLNTPERDAGFEAGFVGTDAGSERLEAWLKTRGGRDFVDQLGELVGAMDPATASARELAFALRTVQLQMKAEAAARAFPAGEAVSLLGADQLMPLLMPVIARGATLAMGPGGVLPAWAILERLRSLDDETLTQFPDLAQALAGWEDACGRIEARALARWRRAAVEAMWWRGLCRVPPPNVVLVLAELEPRPLREIPFVSRMVDEAHAIEKNEAWPAAADGRQAYGGALLSAVLGLQP